MVTVNVAQLLQSPPGTVREADFSERLPNPSGDVHLHEPVRGHAKLTRTSRGILVESNQHTSAEFECSRCLRDLVSDVDASFAEEFLPSVDIRTGVPTAPEEGEEDPDLLINEHHEIELDELLRQSILTSLPFQPLCEAACPGLCATCGERLDARHLPHPENAEEVEQPSETYRPFAGLAELLQNHEKDDDAAKR